MFCFINEDKKLLTRVDEEKIQGEGMLTRDLVMEKLRDLEQDYCDFLVTHFAQWDVWADIS